MKKIDEIGGVAGTKDAFHVPCVCVYCRQELNPGDYVRFISPTEVVHSLIPEAIVSPFLKESIKPYKTVWVMLHPDTITGLTHLFQTNITALEYKDEDKDDSYYHDECRGCY